MRMYQMEKDVSFSFMLASLALLVPFPGRLAYGLVLVLLLNIQLLSVSLFRKLVEAAGLDDLLSVLTAAMLVCESCVFKQLLSLFSPLMALTLSFVIYLPAVSSFVISHLRPQDRQLDLAEEVRRNMKSSLSFSGFALLFFLLRDIAGYGTVSFPGRRGLACIRLLPQGEGSHVGVFLATVPGAVLLVSVFFFAIWQVRRKLDSLGGSPDERRA